MSHTTTIPQKLLKMNRLEILETKSIRESSEIISELYDIFLKKFKRNSDAELCIFTSGLPKSKSERHGISLQWEDKDSEEADFYKQIIEQYKK